MLDAGVIKGLERFIRESERFDGVLSHLASHTWKEVRADIMDFLQSYSEKLNEERKLRIAVVGQVKAGKSTFLNCFLFDCEGILPEASTPMTASLNVITHSSSPRVVIEYYNREDLEQLKKYDGQDEEIRRGFELIGEVESLPREIEVKGVAELKEILREYVSTHGDKASVVKSLYVYLDREDLSHVEIIDTPGLNDPVLSRQRKTLEFMERADIILFISPASHFMSREDIRVLSMLHGRGSARVYPIAGRFDNALVSAASESLFSKKKEDFQQLYEEVRRKLQKEYEKHFIEKHKPDSKYVGSKVLVFSSLFRKLELGLGLEDKLSPSERKPLENLKRRTRNFNPIGFSGFDELNGIIRKYFDEKTAKIEREGIIRRYMKERPVYIARELKVLIDRVEEEETKKRETFEVELEKLKEEIKHFEGVREEVEEALKDIYRKYRQQFIEALEKRLDRDKEELAAALDEASELSRDTKTITRVHKEEIEEETFLDRIPVIGGFLGWIGRTFFGFGRSTYVSYDYETITYYRRSIFIDMLNGQVKTIYNQMNSEIRKQFRAFRIKKEILSLLRKYSFPEDIVKRAVDLHFRVPQISPPNEIEQHLYQTVSRFSEEISEENFGEFIETVRRFSEQVIDYFRDRVSEMEKEVEKQLGGNIEKVMEAIASYMDEKLNYLRNSLNMTEDKYETFKKELGLAKEVLKETHSILDSYIKEVIENA